jgi:hypothetical protein
MDSNDSVDRPGMARPRRGASILPASVTAVAIGILAAAIYYREDLTLSHYDARAHLVVARRVVDSLQPGWRQLGGVWLPLPHMLNLLPVQIDWFYRTGLSAVVLSVAGFVLAASSLWWLVERATRSRWAAWTAFAIFVAQPDVLYLQATPMTEALLMGFSLLGVALAWKWVSHGATQPVWPAGVSLALACLTRYEAWTLSGGVVLFSAAALARRGVTLVESIRRASMLAIWPTAAMLMFMVLSRATVGAWLVTGGFFSPDVTVFHQPVAIATVVMSAVRTMNGTVVTTWAAISVGIVLFIVWNKPERAPLMVILALFLGAIVPISAFWNGHPVRIRYMVPSTMIVAAAAGLGTGLLQRGRAVVACIVITAAIVETPPIGVRSPMVVEASRNQSDRVERRTVTECLVQDFDDTSILASMGSLAPYMQDAAVKGFALRQFVHEGTGQLWKDSLLSPTLHVGWILIDEHNQERDVLAQERIRSTVFLSGFSRFCEAGGLVLYRRAEG